MQMHLQLSLSLPRALMLLAIDGAHGSMRPASGLRHGLVGAALVELNWRGRVIGDGSALVLADTRDTGDPTLDAVLGILRQHGPSDAPRTWILRLAHTLYNLEDCLLVALERDGVLRREQTRRGGGVPSRGYRLLAAGLQVELRAQVRQAVRFVQEPGEAMLALIGLLQASDLLGAVLSRHEAWQARARLPCLRPTDATSHIIIATVDQVIRDSEGLAYIVGIG